MEWLTSVLGIYTRFFIMSAQEVLTLFGYFLALTWYKKKRKFYIARLFLVLLVSLALCVPLSIFRTCYNVLPVRIFNTGIILAIIFGWLFACYREKPNELILCFSGIVAAKNLSGYVFAFLLNCFGVDDLVSMSFFNDVDLPRDWAIYWLVHAVLLAGVYVFLRKREELQDEKMTRRAVILAVFTYLFFVVVSSATRYFQEESFALSVCTKILQIIVCSFILLFRSNLLFQSKISKELQITEQLLYQEKKHYAEMKGNIDVINMKCHDIKHQLTNLQGRLTDAEIHSLQEAIRIYDSNIRTGSEILDTILYQKQLYCEKNGITLKFLADGKAFGFMRGSDLYALVSNALDNAIEAVIKLAEKEKRIVNLFVLKKGNELLLEVSNYFDPLSPTVLGTSKKEKQYHGFGIKSMQYITNQYKGKFSTEIDGDVFFLSVLFPVLS